MEDEWPEDEWPEETDEAPDMALVDDVYEKGQWSRGLALDIPRRSYFASRFKP